jgi:hypothetical protein
MGTESFEETFVVLAVHGRWLPGRQLVVVLPLAAIAIAWWVRAGGARLAGAVALGAVGVVAQAFIVTEGLRGRLAWVVDLQTTADPLYRAMRWITPDYLVEDAATWPLHWAWTVALAAAALWAWRRERADAQSEKTIPAGSPGSAAMSGSAARSAA